MAEVKNGGCGTIRYTQKAHKDVRPEDRLARTMYVIITDGMESASLCCTTDEVRGLVKQQGAEGWEFVFLGANIDAVQVRIARGDDLRILCGGRSADRMGGEDRQAPRKEEERSQLSGEGEAQRCRG